MPADAIRHALAAGDFRRTAADLMRLSIPFMRRNRQEATALGWLRTLPDELVRARPVLSVYYAGTLQQSGELDGVETRLRDAERWLTPRTVEQPDVPPQMVVVDYEEFRRLPGSIAVQRAGEAVVRGTVHDTLHFAQRALNLLPAEDNLGRGSATALLAIAHWTRGDLEAAHRMYGEGMPRLLKAGHFSDLLGCTIAMADILLAQGRLHEHAAYLCRGLQLATEGGGPVLRGAADMHVGLSTLYLERNDLPAATQHLQNWDDLGEHAGLRQYPYRTAWSWRMQG